MQPNQGQPKAGNNAARESRVWSYLRRFIREINAILDKVAKVLQKRAGLRI
jgi:hypothetical protein